MSLQLACFGDGELILLLWWHFCLCLGTSTLDEVVTGLMEAVEVFEGTRSVEVTEDRERQSRQAIKNDQDAAYQESLRADRAKVYI